MEFKMSLSHPQSMQKLNKVLPAEVFYGQVRSIQHTFSLCRKQLLPEGKAGKEENLPNSHHHVLVKLPYVAA